MTPVQVSDLFICFLCPSLEGETSDDLKVQSHVSIGSTDLLIVGPGVLGRLVAEQWRQVSFLCCMPIHLCLLQGLS